MQAFEHDIIYAQILFKTIKSKIIYETPRISSIKWYENKAEKMQITMTQILFRNIENKIISLKSREFFLSNHLIYILYENKAISTFPVCNKGRDLQKTL
jgi:hypothetical protein